MPLGASARAAAALILMASAATSCALVLGLQDRQFDPSTSSTTPPPCNDPGDCPLAGDACFVRVCVDHLCGLSDAPKGTAVLSQTAGDCKRVVCDDQGQPATVPDGTDPFDDGRACTDDYCDGTLPKHRPTAIGKGCGASRVCNGMGSCVECLEDNDCPMTAGTVICDKFHCVPITCDDGMKDNFETDIDCGGECNPCKDGQICKSGNDCESQVCVIGVCQAPTCNDGTKNGPETGTDCGGGCPPCPDGTPCNTAGDCTSGVCSGTPPVCQVPTCNDAVQNGNEMAVDCGGHCPPGSCDDGEPCKEPPDCQSGVCLLGICQAATCTDGVQNGTEQGIDCGGSCKACP